MIVTTNGIALIGDSDQMHIDTYASHPWTLFSGSTNAPYPSTTLTQQVYSTNVREGSATVDPL
jgi:hypothetical protein